MFLDEPSTKIDWSAAADFTEVDVTDDIPDDTVRAVYLGVDLTFRGHNDVPSSEERMEARFRPLGSSETELIPKVRGATGYLVADDWAEYAYLSHVLFVPCVNKIFEVALVTISGTPQSIEFKVHLLGYFP